MLNTDQVILIQTACNKAGIRKHGEDGRYRLLLAQYRQPNGDKVVSCKQLNKAQLEDVLAICESQGWRMPGKSETHYRDKVASQTDANFATFTQQQAIKYLAEDLGFTDIHLANFIKRMIDGKDSVAELTPHEAWKITEALTAMLRRNTGIDFKDLKEIKDYFFRKEGTTNGKTCQV